MFSFCDFTQVFVFTTNHHLEVRSRGVKTRNLCSSSIHYDKGPAHQGPQIDGLPGASVAGPV